MEVVAEIYQIDNIVCVSLKGTLDILAYDAIEKNINNLFNHKKYKLIVDFSEVNYIISAVIGFLGSSAKVAQYNNGNLIIYNPNQQVRRIFERVGYSHVFTVTDNLKSALKLLSEGDKCS